jgi:hypothetical protein
MKEPNPFESPSNSGLEALFSRHTKRVTLPIVMGLSYISIGVVACYFSSKMGSSGEE